MYSLVPARQQVNPFERITPIDAIGLELWTMSENVAFDNFILADDVSVVDQWTEETWALKVAKEGATAPSGPTVLHQLFDAANERPWLWVVYIIGLLIPICVMTMIFCPVKKDEGDGDESKARQYDSIRDETKASVESTKESKEEEALRKKTDEPVPDVIEDAVDGADIAVEEADAQEPAVMQPEEEEARPTTPVKLTNGNHATSNGFHEEEEGEEPMRAMAGKSILNGIDDEDEILRRSPRLKSKTRSRKE